MADEASSVEAASLLDVSERVAATTLEPSVASSPAAAASSAASLPLSMIENDKVKIEADGSVTGRIEDVILNAFAATLAKVMDENLSSGSTIVEFGASGEQIGRCTVAVKFEFVTKTSTAAGAASVTASATGGPQPIDIRKPTTKERNTAIRAALGIPKK